MQRSVSMWRVLNLTSGSGTVLSNSVKPERKNLPASYHCGVPAGAQARAYKLCCAAMSHVWLGINASLLKFMCAAVVFWKQELKVGKVCIVAAESGCVM